MIIKAGTYRFNDEPTAPNSQFTLSFTSITFPDATVNMGGADYTLRLSPSPNWLTVNVKGEIIFTNNYFNLFSILANGEPIEDDCIVLAVNADNVWSPKISNSAGENITEQYGININEYGKIFTVNEPLEVDDEAAFTWFTSNTQMLIKAGTYKWNDDTTPPSTSLEGVDIPLKFTIPSFNLVSSEYNGVITCDELSVLWYTGLIISDVQFFNIAYTKQDNSPISLYLNNEKIVEVIGIAPMKLDSENRVAWKPYVMINGQSTMTDLTTLVGDGAMGYGQIITVTEDQYVPTNFGLWAVENGQEYSEETEETTPTADSVKAKIQSLIAKANNTTGKSDTDLTSGVNSLIAGFGQGGSCSGNHIIEVEELPTENIDETALYKCGDSYYQYAKELKDIYEAGDGNKVSYTSFYSSHGYTVELYYVKTKEEVENPAISDVFNGGKTVAPYYVEAEKDIFLYGDNEGTGTNSWQAVGATTITDENEIDTSVSGVYALVINGWQEYTNGVTPVITVDELPTENIDERAVYKLNCPYLADLKADLELPPLPIVEGFDYFLIYDGFGEAADYTVLLITDMPLTLENYNKKYNWREYWYKTDTSGWSFVSKNKSTLNYIDPYVLTGKFANYDMETEGGARFEKGSLESPCYTYTDGTWREHIIPWGVREITENCEIDTTNCASVIVAIPEYDGTIIIEDALTLAGFTGLTNASGELTLTDSIAEVATYSTATSGTAVTVSNDLDNYFPYNQITEFTDADGNVFVKFPKMYIKWVLDADGNIDGWQVSDKEFEGSFIPDCYLNSDGVSYNDYFAISKYSMSGTKDKGYSVSGQAPLTSITRAEARAAARAYGTADNYYGGYQIMDMSMVTVYNFLCMMYYQTSNIQSVFAGRVSHDGPISTGGTDAISGMNGWDTETGATKMLGVENYYCNVAHWIDGVTFVNGLAYLPRLPQNYSDTSDNCVASEVVLPVATSAPYWSKHLQAGTTAGTQSYVFQSDYAAEYDNTDVWEDQYSCDLFVYVNAEDTPIVLFGGGCWGFGSVAGLWVLGAEGGASFSYSLVGARLSYRPL